MTADPTTEPTTEEVISTGEDAAPAKRDRGTKPADLLAYAIGGVKDIKLTRMGHYHAGTGADGRCFAALITGVDEAAGTVNVTAWPAGRFDEVTRAGSAIGSAAHIVVPVADPADDASGTFHLSRECPWAR